jgi:hypothetical protein
MFFTARMMTNEVDVPGGELDAGASIASGSKQRKARLRRAGADGLRAEPVRGDTPSRAPKAR